MNQPKGEFMILNLIKKEIDTLNVSTLVIFSKTSSQKDKGAKVTHPALSKMFQSATDEKTITGKQGEAIFFREKNYINYRHILVVGLGKENEITHESVRQSMVTIVDTLKGAGINEAVIDFDGLNFGKKLAVEGTKAVAEGLMLASYVFDELMSNNKDKKEMNLHLVTEATIEKAVKAAFTEGIELAGAVNFARRLGDMPGNLMTPTILAQHAIDAAKGVANLKVTAWDKAKIQKEKMGGLLGVSQGSSQEPRFIVMEYKGAAATKKPIAFVGKGLTFDCGGISIKPSAGMEEMKFDMCGGAAVIGTMLAIAKLKLKVNVIGLIPATENLAGPSATKPGDVHIARNGKTFEINNTDAEGRLILSDALCYASEQEPQMIVDVATLTGAMVVALGNTHTGYFTRNKDLKNKIEDAAEQSGEWVWNLPLCDFHVKDMKGTYADLSNISAGKGAGSATAAAFLEQFVGEGIPWAHFDIAGTGWAVGNRLPYCSKKGASGVMVRTFVELAKEYI